MVNTKHRKKTLGLLGVLIGVLSVVFGQMLGDELKTKYDDLKKVETDWADSLGLETTQYQFVNLEQQLQLRDVEIETHKPEPDRDYSPEIQADSVTVNGLAASLTSSLTNASNLLTHLHYGKIELQRQLDSLRPDVKKTIDQANSVLEPNGSHDWDRALFVKVQLVSVLLRRIQVLVIAIAAVSQLEREQEQANARYQLCKYATWILGLLGFGLTGYAIATGVEGSG
jgi:hypothetical protein